MAIARPVPAAISWSGGKDCCLALERSRPAYDVRVALTMFDEAGTRSRSHGLRPEVVRAQADRLGLPLLSGHASWAGYEGAFIALLQAAARTGVTHVIFGDIFEDAHRAWNERVAAAAGLTAVQPLWGEPTLDLAREFLDRGGEARLSTVRLSALDETWAGQPLTHEALAAFAARGIDPAGERGEYHTVVTGCALFSSPLALTPGARVEVGGCCAVDFTC